MAIEYKDINQLTQKSSLSGTEKIEVSDTEFITPNQIAALAPGGGDTLWEAGSGTNSIQVVNSEGDAIGNYSSVEGKGCVTGGDYTENTLVAGTSDTTKGSYAHAEGRFCISNGGVGSHAEGNRTLASGQVSHAEGNQTVASGSSSHSEGYRSYASGQYTHAEGGYSKAIGNRSHAESHSLATGANSHAELGDISTPITLSGAASATQYTANINTENAPGFFSLYNTLDSTMFTNILLCCAIAKTNTEPIRITSVTSVSMVGNSIVLVFTVEKTISTSAISDDSSYSLFSTNSRGANSHAEGSIAYGDGSHAEGVLSVSMGGLSHSEGEITITKNRAEHAEGSYNVSNKASDTYGNAGNTQHSIGIGSSSARKNAVEVMQNGDVYVYGVGGYDGTNISQADTLQDVVGGGGGGGSTTDCVHKTGDETVGGDKTFTDDIIVGDASNIKYGASSGSGFTRGVASQYNSSSANSIAFTGLSGEPKAFVLSAYEQGGGVLMVVGDSTGCHGIYNTGSQHNYSASFTKSYSNGVLTVTAPTGVTFIADSTYNLIYYYGDGTLTFKTSQVQPGSGVTAVTFTGNGLTEIPAMYACFLETAVNNEQYRRVAGYTNSAYDNEEGEEWPEGITFLTGGPQYTTSSFSVSYNNGLVINSGGTNAGGYFHNPGTYTLYYLTSADIGGGGGGSYSNLADELAAINTTIGDIATILASI